MATCLRDRTEWRSGVQSAPAVGRHARPRTASQSGGASTALLQHSRLPTTRPLRTGNAMRTPARLGRTPSRTACRPPQTSRAGRAATPARARPPVSRRPPVIWRLLLPRGHLGRRLSLPGNTWLQMTTTMSIVVIYCGWSAPPIAPTSAIGNLII